MTKKITYNSLSTNPDFISFFYQLSKYCDKNCPYCTSYESKISIKNKEKVENKSKLIYDKIFKYIIEFYSKHEGLLNLFGGEPTIHNDFIKYYNDFSKNVCQVFPNRWLFVTTHGEHLKEVIPDLDIPRNHFFSVSYHHYTTKWNIWLENLKYLKDNNINFIVSSIIPRLDRVHPKYFERMKILKDLNIPLEFKLEFDQETIDIKIEHYYKFKNLFKETEKTIKGFNFPLEIFSDFKVTYDNKDKIFPYYTILSNIPLFKNTYCINKSVGIYTDIKNNQMVFNSACGEGIKYIIDDNTNHNFIEDYFKQNHHKMLCTQKFCNNDRHNPNKIITIATNKKNITTVKKWDEEIE